MLTYVCNNIDIYCKSRVYAFDLDLCYLILPIVGNKFDKTHVTRQSDYVIFMLLVAIFGLGNIPLAFGNLRTSLS